MAQGITDLKKLSEFLDTKYRLPGGFRIGWDGIIGFIPGLGDLVSNILSSYIMARAAMVGAPPAVILRMGINVLIDNVVDIVPIFGNFFDIFWKSNTRNVALVEKYMNNPRGVNRSSKWMVFATLVFILGLLAASVGVVVLITLKVLEYVMQSQGW
ncbi:MAG: DUF4112 domain-containing protein [Bdellovibrionales bacterium]|nr:DUF4112 domain-containing protein [Bdellovibrionales bacterium]